MPLISRIRFARLTLATSLLLLTSQLGAHRLRAQQPDVQVETTSTLQLTFPRSASEAELAQQLADQLTVATSRESVPFLRQAELSAGQDESQVSQIAQAIRMLLDDGHDATTTPLLFVTVQPAAAVPLTLGLLNIQAVPALPPLTSLLAWHEAQHARINNELTRRLAPALSATAQGHGQTATTLAATLVRILHDGGVAFDAVTNYGREGDQETAATAVIETITQTAGAELGRLAVGP